MGWWWGLMAAATASRPSSPPRPSQYAGTPGDYRPGRLKVKNVAAVIVTATLPAFARPGSTIDVVVSSVGDARTLQGGTLLQTPLQAANGGVYAVAQGPVTVGGFSAGGGGSSVAKNHTTVGRVPGGATVERETKTEIAPQDTLHIALNTNDFTTAYRAANAIDDKLGATSPGTDSNVISVMCRTIIRRAWSP